MTENNNSTEKAFKKYEIQFDLLKQSIREEITKIFSVSDSDNFQEKLKTVLKQDESILTHMDQFISDLFKNEFMQIIPGYNFYSEEEKSHLQFPALIIDPIDGTKEFSEAIPECCVSVGIFNSPDLSDPLNYAWMYNPLSGFEISSKDILTRSNNLAYTKDILSGLVSATEWGKGLFQDYNTTTQTQLLPLGSIAFKLALLASGGTDFVISKKPKNLWDIAGGSLLCHQRGISFFQQGQKIKLLNEEKYFPDLLWCKEDLYDSLKENK